MRALGLLLACLAVSACGSSAAPVAATTGTDTSPAATTATPPPGTAATATSAPAIPTATVPAPATTTTTATSSPPAPPAGQCVAAGLHLSVLSQQGAPGHGVLALAVRNVGSARCHTFGFPGVLFLDAAGGSLPTDPAHVTSDFVGPVPAHALTLAPGQSASFRLVVSHGSTTPALCATAHALQVIAPDDTATLRTALPGGLTECGAVTVSPLQAGLSANPAS